MAHEEYYTFQHLTPTQSQQEDHLNAQNDIESLLKDKSTILDHFFKQEEDETLSLERKKVLTLLESFIKQYFERIGLEPLSLGMEDILYIDISKVKNFDWSLMSDEEKQTIADLVELGRPLAGGFHWVHLVVVQGFDYLSQGFDPDPLFVKINEAGILAHEVYHASVPLKVKTEKDLISEDRQGLSYEKYKLGSILEEGMAMLFQDEFIKSVILQYLSEEERNRFTLCKEKASKELNVSQESLCLVREFQNGAVAVFQTFPKEVEIVKILRDELTRAGFDFYKLFENARRQHKTISLAKAIESIFGKGTYRRLIEVNSKEERNELLLWLRNSRKTLD